jgi:hypothetical protein
LFPFQTDGPCLQCLLHQRIHDRALPVHCSNCGRELPVVPRDPSVSVSEQRGAVYS